jgi:peptidyl-tRNA hydrolase, PTH2 family
MGKEKRYEAKQVLVIRKDIEMPQGKVGAQLAHASCGALLSLVKFKERKNRNTWTIADNKEGAVSAWLEGRFAKIVCFVRSEEEIIELYEKAKAAGLPCALIKDAGFTVFKGVPTITAVGIGPGFIEDVDKITKHLRLL